MMTGPGQRIETGPEMTMQNLSVLKVTWKGTLRQLFIIRLRPLPLSLGGLVIVYVGSESGHIQSVKLLQYMLSNTTRHPSTPQSHTV